ncbi:MAG: acyltransferase [Planctomycetes bacterium]|nr:acyltransferase [Planctomycetota bacterium]
MTTDVKTKIRSLRLLFILLVVLIHSDLGPSVKGQSVGEGRLSDHLAVFARLCVSPGLTDIAVPAFFVLSGFLFFHGLEPTGAEYLGKYRRRLGSLLLPYLLWSGAYLLAYGLLQTVPFTARYFSGDPQFIVWQFDTWQVAKHWLLVPIPVQFWFLRDLILLVVVSPLIGYFLRRWGIWAILPLGAMWGMGMCPGHTRSVITVIAPLFFFLGSYLALQRSSVIEKEITRKRLLLLAWLCAVAIRAYLTTEHGPFTQPLGKLGVALGIPAIWCNYDLVQRLFESRFGLFVSHFTFFIYAGHQPLLKIIEKLARSGSLPCEPTTLPAFFLGPLLAVMICVLVAAFMSRNRLLRPIYTVLIGGR